MWITLVLLSNRILFIMFLLEMWKVIHNSIVNREINNWKMKYFSSNKMFS